MAIYTLPGPIYDYSLGLVDFEADVIEFTVSQVMAVDKLKTNKSSKGEKAGGGDLPMYVATMKLSVKSTMGLASVKASITPSNADLGGVSTTPLVPGITTAQVADSQVWSSPYLARTTEVTFALNFRPHSAATGVVTFMLTARQLTSAAIVSANYP